MRFWLPFKNSVPLRIAFFLFLIIPSPIIANSNQELSHESVQNLIDKSLKETYSQNYAEALEILLKAHLAAEENGWNDKLWLIKNRIGIVYSFISNYGEAFTYFKASYEITQKNEELNRKGIVPLTNIGLLLAKEEKYEEALHYYKKAYKEAKSIGDDSDVKFVANNLVSLLVELKRYDEGLLILDEIYALKKDKVYDFFLDATYIEILVGKNELQKAKNLAYSLYKSIENESREQYQEERCQSCLEKILAQIYFQYGEADSAIFYAQKALANTSELKDKIILYERLSMYYKEKKDFENLSLYKDSVIISKDSLSKIINRNLFEVNKVKFRVQEYQNELTAKKSQQIIERILFAVILLFGVSIAFFLYRGIRNRTRIQKQQARITTLAFEKEKIEHLLAKKQLQTNLLKQKQLKYSIAEKNRELSAKSIYLSNRNEIINEIIFSLESNNKIQRNEETKKQIKEIRKFLKTDESKDDFLKHFESVNPGLLKILKKKHPNLNINDLRFLCYVYMNLSLKEICIIFNITYDACRIRRARIAKKMELKKPTAIYSYLLSL